MELLAHLHAHGIQALFSVAVANDLEQPDKNLLQLVQGGIGLPLASYYLNTTRSVLLEQYRDHIAKSLALGLDQKNDSFFSQMAFKIVGLEKSLASIFLPNFTGDYLKTKPYYHKTYNASKEIPHFGFDVYFKMIDYSEAYGVNLAGFSFFSNLTTLLKNLTSTANGIDTLRWYFRWQSIHTWSPFLSQSFRDEYFSFYGKILQGQVSFIEALPILFRRNQHPDGNNVFLKFSQLLWECSLGIILSRFDFPEIPKLNSLDSSKTSEMLSLKIWMSESIGLILRPGMLQS